MKFQHLILSACVAITAFTFTLNANANPNNAALLYVENNNGTDPEFRSLIMDVLGIALFVGNLSANYNRTVVIADSMTTRANLFSNLKALGPQSGYNNVDLYIMAHGATWLDNSGKKHGEIAAHISANDINAHYVTTGFETITTSTPPPPGVPYTVVNPVTTPPKLPPVIPVNSRLLMAKMAPAAKPAIIAPVAAKPLANIATSSDGGTSCFFGMCSNPHGGPVTMYTYKSPILEYYEPGSLITDDDFRANIIGMSNLRFVWQINCFGESMNQAFRDIGAKVVIGAIGINDVPYIDLPQFFSNYSAKYFLVPYWHMTGQWWEVWKGQWRAYRGFYSYDVGTAQFLTSLTSYPVSASRVSCLILPKDECDEINATKVINGDNRMTVTNGFDTDIAL